MAGLFEPLNAAWRGFSTGCLLLGRWVNKGKEKGRSLLRLDPLTLVPFGSGRLAL
jgi:hypothetical protein